MFGLPNKKLWISHNTMNLINIRKSGLIFHIYFSKKIILIFENRRNIKWGMKVAPIIVNNLLRNQLKRIMKADVILSANIR
jgi:hypothetical protein